jgi:hypothetical protein
MNRDMRNASPALVSEADFIAAQDISAARGLDVRHQASAEDVISYLRERQITLTYDPASGTVNAGTSQAITLTAS